MRKLRSYRQFTAAMSFGLTLAIGGCKFPDDVSGSANSTGTLIVVNETSAPVFYLYISTCSSPNWGEDRLGSDDVIPPRATRSWTLTPGCYDVRAEFIDDNYVESRLTIQSDASFTWRLVE